MFADIDATGNKNFLVRASFLEIYNEDVRDLLAKDQTKKCDLKVGCGGCGVWMCVHMHAELAPNWWCV